MLNNSRRQQNKEKCPGQHYLLTRFQDYFCQNVDKIIWNMKNEKWEIIIKENLFLFENQAACACATV